MEDMTHKRTLAPPRLVDELKRQILSGAFGAPGERFLTVRKLAERQNVSLVTAQRAMVALRDGGFVILDKNKSRIAIPAKISAGKLVGMVVTNLESPFFALLAREAQAAAARAGAKMLIAGSDYDQERERGILELFMASKVDGVLACPGVAPGTCDLYAGLKVPVVFIARDLDGLEADAVLVDNRSAARRTARHLLGLERCSHAYIGPDCLNNDHRWEGFAAGLRAGGVAAADIRKLAVDIKGYELEEARFADFLSGLPKPAAVFCFHDLMATMAMRVAAQLGFRVPQDLAVAGFDDLPIAARLRPSLTSSSYPLREMAANAAELLLGKIARLGSPCPEKRTLTPTLIVRESTGGEAPPLVGEPVPDFATYQFS